MRSFGLNLTPRHVFFGIQGCLTIIALCIMVIIELLKKMLRAGVASSPFFACV